MAVLSVGWLHSLRGLISKPESAKDVNTRRVREAVHDSYRRSGGPTPELQRVFRAYVENERRKGAG
jgi:hypothetical protein